MSNNNEESSIIIPNSFDSWCKTEGSEEVKFTFGWTIKDFSERSEENGQVLDSSKFTIQSPDGLETEWNLELYPKGDNKDASGFMSIYLR